MSDTHPLCGLTVIDFTHVLAGPACSYYLGLLGAKVIKVESRHKGDAIRHRGGTDQNAADQGMSTPYLTQGAGKQSIALDLGDETDRATFERLLQHGDILVENHLPETMRALDLDAQAIASRHPHLIHCAMTGYGRNGPQENAPAYDVNIQASCGLMDMTGTLDSGPIRTGAPILDYATALAAAFAISAALVARAQTGRGTFIDISMLETGLSLMGSSVTDYMQTGNEPQRRGNLANSRSPGAGSFACKSGIISLGVNEETHFHNLAQALDRPDWLSDPRFAQRASRKQHADQLVQEIEDILATKTAQDWEVILQNAGVPAARLRTMAEALNSDQIKARNYLARLPDRDLAVPTLPFRLGHVAGYRPSLDAPELGADTRAVLDWLDEMDQNA